MRIRYDLFGLGFNKEDGPYHHKAFEDLLYDAVLLAYLAHDRSDAEDAADKPTTMPGALTRASVLNSTLVVECSANCCLETLPWSGSMRQEVDKLSAMTKLELFLKNRKPESSIDRGAAPVQRAEELKSLRDRYVHPKVRRLEWKQESDREQSVDLGQTPMLKIPYDTGIWGPSVSVVALRTATDFLSHFFIDLCGLHSNQVCEILLGSTAVKLPYAAGYAVDCIGDLDRAVRDWQISFRFLGK
jgi:hypothetical protein